MKIEVGKWYYAFSSMTGWSGVGRCAGVSPDGKTAVIELTYPTHYGAHTLPVSAQEVICETAAQPEFRLWLAWVRALIGGYKP